MKLTIKQLIERIRERINTGKLGYFGTFLNKTEYYFVSNDHFLFMKVLNPYNNKSLLVEIIDNDHLTYFLMKCNYESIPGFIRVDTRSLTDEIITSFLPYSGGKLYKHSEDKIIGYEG